MFESRIANYQKARVMNNWNEQTAREADGQALHDDMEFRLDAEF